MSRKKIKLQFSIHKLFIFCTLLLSGFLFFSLSACRQNSNTEKAVEGEVVTDSMPEQTTSPTADTPLMKLKEYAGAYPSDVDLLEQPVLKGRLEALLGGDYANFKKYWQTETPVEIEDNVLATSGCEQHNCAANQYVLQIDLAENNINVYHLGPNGIQSYLEKGPITLPPGLAKEFQATTENNKQ